MGNFERNLNKEILNQFIKKVFGIPLFLENGNFNPEFLQKFCPKAKNLEVKQLKWEKNAEIELSDAEKEKGFIIEFSDEDGILSFLQTKEDYVKFLVEYFLNEIESIQNSIQQIAKGQHNDRISDILSAAEKYEKATYTKDVQQKKQMLIDAESTLINGLHKIQKEIEQHITTITNLPKGRVKKLFCGTNINQIKQTSEELKEAFFIYQQGLFLVAHLDTELKEEERMITSITRAKELLEDRILENTERLNQFDIQKEAFWLEKPQLFYDKLDGIQKLITSSENIFEMEG